ncbi:MAG: DNA translocase FtsK 4TM domain-containing protein [Deltaproteobacteria bacterium]|nr:DNA translocase FtsK 4TM domain-containing protein [Deltaproteobacteria bacterium]
MAAKGKTAKAAPPARGRGKEIAGICLLGLGVFSLISMVSSQLGANGVMGPGGAATARLLYAFAGFSAYLVVGAVLVLAVRCFKGSSLLSGIAETLGSLGVVSALAVLLHLPFATRHTESRGPGGFVGQWIGEILASFIGTVGAALAALTVLFLSLTFLTSLRAEHAWAAVAAVGQRSWAVVREAGAALARLVVEMFPGRGADEEYEEDDTVQAESLPAPSTKKNKRALPPLEETLPFEKTLVAFSNEEPQAAVAAPKAKGKKKRSGEDTLAAVAAMAQPTREEPVEDEDAPVSQVDAEDELEAISGEFVEEDTRAPKHEEIPIIVAPAVRPPEPAKKHEGPGFIKLSAGEFRLPSTSMLKYEPPKGEVLDKLALYDMAERLEQAFSNYGVKGKVKEIHMGPVVTMYEFAPAPGTRTGKIARLEDDLAMALEAQAVRIVAPIPGKAVVGVEVPNKLRETVYLKEILEDDCFLQGGSKLQVCLGKDIKGTPVSVSLGKMPHLLVAGTTGSGKSVAVNSMITSILYNASPEEVRFIMVDPKMLELSIYEGIPHLLLPVVTDPTKANLALRWAVEEMERRYELLAKTGVRDIAGFNVKVDRHLANKKTQMANAAALAEADGEEAQVFDTGGVIDDELSEDLSDRQAAAQAKAEQPDDLAAKLPYIVIVIDEFADLMMVAPKDVETSVARIAQKARAAGLHLILATQRPSVDVITGLIKANFPSRIALQVASRIDSRTILDQPGAETLLGNGDMLFSDRGTKLRRIHGAFLSDDEVHAVVDFLKKQAKPVYDMDILKPRDDEGDGEGAMPANDFHDALYDQAVAIVCDTRQASVSFIQRRLQIGYNRAARMVEQMEREGIVGPANGMKPRDILAPQGEYLAAH